MSNQTSSSIVSIKVGLATLPQELYDEVFDLVFTAPIEPVRDLNSPDLRTHLNLLHVSHTTREQYATSYYTVAFIVRESQPYRTRQRTSSFRFDRISRVLKWLLVLPKPHRDLVKRITLSGDQRDAYEAPPEVAIAKFELYWPNAVRLARVELDKKLFERVGERVYGHTMDDM